MSVKIRDYLVERAIQGGTSAVDEALSEAGASCSRSSQSYHCEIRRFRVLAGIGLINPRYHRTDWTMSVSYDRRGNSVRNIHVTYTQTGGLIAR